ncbi:hypothetical protein NDU88_002196 [Pleurodeles waltl]|uniref:Uncharacterized protein n=1 Tax=Pleurodeles waltl TaxID=8319 RepID=A0AAV7W2K3_PLEWA|nr:hypothetical protein NDU88_002196 [Pleurodeles waltl]
MRCCPGGAAHWTRRAPAVPYIREVLRCRLRPRSEPRFLMGSLADTEKRTGCRPAAPGGVRAMAETRR